MATPDINHRRYLHQTPPPINVEMLLCDFRALSPRAMRSWEVAPPFYLCKELLHRTRCPSFLRQVTPRGTIRLHTPNVKKHNAAALVNANVVRV